MKRIGDMIHTTDGVYVFDEVTNHYEFKHFVDPSERKPVNYDEICISAAVREKNLARIERDGCWDYEEGLTKFLNSRSKENVDRVFIPVKVIFSGPATICFFADGTKEIVKQSAEEPNFDTEKAMMYCIIKRIMRHFPGDNNAINKYGYFKRQISSLAEEESEPQESEG